MAVAVLLNGAMSILSSLKVVEMKNRIQCLEHGLVYVGEEFCMDLIGK